MRRRDIFLNILLILEAGVLVIVLVVGLVNSGISNFTSRRTARTLEEEENIVSAEEQNAVDINAIPEEEEEAEAEEVEEAEEEAEAEEIEEVEEEKDNSITGTGSAYEAMVFSDEVMDLLDEMTTEQKVAQLFVTTPEELTGNDVVTLAGDATKTAVEEYPVGGLVYSADNIQNLTQIYSMIRYTQEYMEDTVGVDTFAMIEEIGGTDHSPLADVSDTIIAPDSPADIGRDGNTDLVTDSAQMRAEYVQESGFNTILGPIADVSTDGSQPDFDEMTFGDNAGNVAECVEYDVKGLQDEGVMAVMRAFPGTYEVTTTYAAYQMGIDAGVDCIMVSNQPDTSLTGEEGMPCSISVQVAQQLRQDMGFEGLLMTSNLSSGVVTDYCSTAEAAVRAVNAGMDLIYVRGSFHEAYDAVLDAAETGEITENILNNAVGRILTEKMD